MQEYKWPGNVRQLKHVVETIAHSQDWSQTNVRREIANAQQHDVHSGSASPVPIDSLDDTDQKILEKLDGTRGIARKALQEELPNLSTEMVKYHLKKLISSKQVALIGAGRNSKYKRA